MPCLSSLIRSVIPPASTLFTLLLDVSRFLGLCFRPSPAPAAENLFHRKQLTLYQEYRVMPERVTHATRSGWCACSDGSLAVRADRGRTRDLHAVAAPGIHLFLRGTSCPGRPPIPVELRARSGR